MPREHEEEGNEANRLYWDTDASVGEIANQLGMSRRALYEAVEPKPSGVPCQVCGTETMFANRSALASGSARCPSCDAETHLPGPRAERVQPAPHVEPALANGNTRTRIAVGLGGAALVGVVVGAIATLLLTHRD
jgi:hypothetical protein